MLSDLSFATDDGYHSLDWTDIFFGFKHVAVSLIDKRLLRNLQSTTLMVDKSSKIIRYTLLQCMESIVKDIL